MVQVVLRDQTVKLPPVIKEIARVIRHPVQYLLLRGVYNRIRQLEYRSFNRRYFAVEQVAEYLVGAQIAGDYCEFGVWNTIPAAAHFQRVCLPVP